MSINYPKSIKIVVTNQAEMDAVSTGFKGLIHVEGAELITISKRYDGIVMARGNSEVKLTGNSKVVAFDCSTVVATESSFVEAYMDSSVWAYNESSVIAWDGSKVLAYNESMVTAWGSSWVEARNSSKVVARDNSSVRAMGNSLIEAWDNSYITACGDSSVVACGNAQVVNELTNGSIVLSANARELSRPKDIYEFMKLYGIKHDNKTAIFYKDVCKGENGYVSLKSSGAKSEDLRFEIGETVTNIYDRQRGIDIKFMDLALQSGIYKGAKPTILEVEVNIEDVIFNKECDVLQALKIKVLREVDLAECGTYGKILSKM